MRITSAILSLMLALTACSNTTKEKGWDSLTEDNHPRLFADDHEFARIKRQIKRGSNEVLNILHRNAMTLADEHGLSDEPLTYKKDESGKRILHVSREAICRIFNAAYAYRMTGDEKYLHHAEKNINDVCRFPDWNPIHYLDCAEMATAVAIGYDWLYHQLQDSTKAIAVNRLQTYAFESSLNPKFTKWYSAKSNWNQVCNGGLVCAALATYEHNPETSKAIIDKAVESNKAAVEGIYPPDGAYPEGPVYWIYGNMYQTMLLSELESTLGTDFGLGDNEAFAKTGEFQVSVKGNTGRFFNYADNLPKMVPGYPLWYLADRFKRPDFVYSEVEFMKNNPYCHVECERLLPLYIIHAANIKPESIKPNAETCYFGDGTVPVAMVRTGWGHDDLYLGIKGGKAGFHHGHCDLGSFVFEADGVRWASDPARQEYAQLETHCKELRDNLWNMKQNSIRWELFRYSNPRHNTLTVNDGIMDVNGFCPITERYQDAGRKGAAVDISEAWPELGSAVREISIRDDSYLEVIDRIKGGEKAAKVRWTLVGDGKPEVCSDGIILKSGSSERYLKTEGAEVCWKIWSSDPASYGGKTAYFETPIPEYICGFEVEIPAGKEVTLVTTLREKEIM